MKSENESRSKLYFWILLDIVLASSALFILFALIPAIRDYGDSFQPARVISVSAQGKTIVSPDVAVASFSVITQGKNPEELVAQNNDKMAAVVQFVKSQGVEDRDVKTTNYNLRPDYGYDENTRRSFIVGYTITQTVTVKMRDFGKIAPIIAGLAPLGINQIGGINFEIEDVEKFLAIARSEAFGRAKAKAAEMAAQNGARLGRVVSISESTTYYPRFATLEAAKGIGDGAPATVSLPEIEPGTQEVTANVSVTYELE